MALLFCFAGSIAILAPWVLTRTGRRALAGLTPAFVATYAWFIYELVVEPKPAGRLDLIVLIQIASLVWLSGLASLVLGAVLDGTRASREEPKQGSHSENRSHRA